MPTTRSRSRNSSTKSPDTIRNTDSRELSERPIGWDIPDGDGKKFFCKKCNAEQLLPEAEKIYESGKGWYWLCEKCYVTSSKDEQSLCFYKILNNGGFSDPSGDQTAFEHKPRPSIIQQWFKVFSYWFDFLIRGPSKVFLNSLSKYVSKVLILSFIVVIGSIIVGVLWYFKPVSEKVEIEGKISEAFKELAISFPHQDSHLWANFESGFHSIASSTKVSPAVFLILHSNNTKTSTCIIKQVCNLAHEHLNVASPPYQLDGNELENKYHDYGDFIIEVENTIKFKKISFIKNLHKMPGNVALALHGLTDAYHPLVEKVIFLMSIPRNISVPSTNDRFELAEEILQDSWRDVKTDILEPLITRLTTNVVNIEDEIKVPEYC